MASGSIRRTPTTGRHGFGLLGMQERASLVGATIQIESAPGQGTTILVRMTLPAGTDGPIHG